MNLSKYNKFWVALTAPLGVLLLVMAPTDGQVAFQVTQAEWYLVVVALGSAIGVRQIANK